MNILNGNIPIENILTGNLPQNQWCVANASVKSGSRLPKNIIGDRVKEARLSHPKMTQKDMADLLRDDYDLHLTQAAISKIEAKTRPVYDFELKAIAALLSIKSGWLLDEEDA